MWLAIRLRFGSFQPSSLGITSCARCSWCSRCGSKGQHREFSSTTRRCTALSLGDATSSRRVPPASSPLHSKEGTAHDLHFTLLQVTQAARTRGRRAGWNAKETEPKTSFGTASEAGTQCRAQQYKGTAAVFPHNENPPVQQVHHQKVPGQSSSSLERRKDWYTMASSEFAATSWRSLSGSLASSDLQQQGGETGDLLRRFLLSRRRALQRSRRSTKRREAVRRFSRSGSGCEDPTSPRASRLEGEGDGPAGGRVPQCSSAACGHPPHGNGGEDVDHCPVIAPGGSRSVECSPGSEAHFAFRVFCAAIREDGVPPMVQHFNLLYRLALAERDWVLLDRMESLHRGFLLVAQGADKAASASDTMKETREDAMPFSGSSLLSRPAMGRRQWEETLAPNANTIDILMDARLQQVVQESCSERSSFGTTTIARTSLEPSGRCAPWNAAATIENAWAVLDLLEVRHAHQIPLSETSLFAVLMAFQWIGFWYQETFPDAAAATSSCVSLERAWQRYEAQEMHRQRIREGLSARPVPEAVVSSRTRPRCAALDAPRLESSSLCFPFPRFIQASPASLVLWEAAHQVYRSFYTASGLNWRSGVEEKHEEVPERNGRHNAVVEEWRSAAARLSALHGAGPLSGDETLFSLYLSHRTYYRYRASHRRSGATAPDTEGDLLLSHPHHRLVKMTAVPFHLKIVMQMLSLLFNAGQHRLVVEEYTAYESRERIALVQHPPLSSPLPLSALGKEEETRQAWWCWERLGVFPVHTAETEDSDSMQRSHEGVTEAASLSVGGEREEDTHVGWELWSLVMRSAAECGDWRVAAHVWISAYVTSLVIGIARLSVLQEASSASSHTDGLWLVHEQQRELLLQQQEHHQTPFTTAKSCSNRRRDGLTASERVALLEGQVSKRRALGIPMELHALLLDAPYSGRTTVSNWDAESIHGSLWAVALRQPGAVPTWVRRHLPHLLEHWFLTLRRVQRYGDILAWLEYLVVEANLTSSSLPFAMGASRGLWTPAAMLYVAQAAAATQQLPLLLALVCGVETRSEEKEPDKTRNASAEALRLTQRGKPPPPEEMDGSPYPVKSWWKLLHSMDRTATSVTAVVPVTESVCNITLQSIQWRLRTMRRNVGQGQPSPAQTSQRNAEVPPEASNRMMKDEEEEEGYYLDSCSYRVLRTYLSHFRMPPRNEEQAQPSSEEEKIGSRMGTSTMFSAATLPLLHSKAAIQHLKASQDPHASEAFLSLTHVEEKKKTGRMETLYALQHALHKAVKHFQCAVRQPDAVCVALLCELLLEARQVLVFFCSSQTSMPCEQQHETKPQPQPKRHSRGQQEHEAKQSKKSTMAVPLEELVAEIEGLILSTVLNIFELVDFYDTRRSGISSPRARSQEGKKVEVSSTAHSLVASLQHYEQQAEGKRVRSVLRHHRDLATSSLPAWSTCITSVAADTAIRALMVCTESPPRKQTPERAGEDCLGGDDVGVVAAYPYLAALLLQKASRNQWIGGKRQRELQQCILHLCVDTTSSAAVTAQDTERMASPTPHPVPPSHHTTGSALRGEPTEAPSRHSASVFVSALTPRVEPEKKHGREQQHSAPKSAAPTRFTAGTLQPCPPTPSTARETLLRLFLGVDATSTPVSVTALRSWERSGEPSSRQTPPLLDANPRSTSSLFLSPAQEELLHVALKVISLEDALKADGTLSSGDAIPEEKDDAVPSQTQSNAQQQQQQQHGSATRKKAPSWSSAARRAEEELVQALRREQLEEVTLTHLTTAEEDLLDSNTMYETSDGSVRNRHSLRVLVINAMLEGLAVRPSFPPTIRFATRLCKEFLLFKASPRHPLQTDRSNERKSSPPEKTPEKRANDGDAFREHPDAQTSAALCRWLRFSVTRRGWSTPLQRARNAKEALSPHGEASIPSTQVSSAAVEADNVTKTEAKAEEEEAALELVELLLVDWLGVAMPHPPPSTREKVATTAPVAALSSMGSTPPARSRDGVASSAEKFHSSPLSHPLEAFELQLALDAITWSVRRPAPKHPTSRRSGASSLIRKVEGPSRLLHRCVPWIANVFPALLADYPFSAPSSEPQKHRPAQGKNDVSLWKEVLATTVMVCQALTSGAHLEVQQQHWPVLHKLLLGEREGSLFAVVEAHVALSSPSSASLRREAHSSRLPRRATPQAAGPPPPRMLHPSAALSGPSLLTPSSALALVDTIVAILRKLQKTFHYLLVAHALDRHRGDHPLSAKPPSGQSERPNAGFAAKLEEGRGPDDGRVGYPRSGSVVDAGPSLLQESSNSLWAVKDDFLRVCEAYMDLLLKGIQLDRDDFTRSASCSSHGPSCCFKSHRITAEVVLNSLIGIQWDLHYTAFVAQRVFQWVPIPSHDRSSPLRNGAFDAEENSSAGGHPSESAMERGLLLQRQRFRRLLQAELFCVSDGRDASCEQRSSSSLSARFLHHLHQWAVILAGESSISVSDHRTSSSASSNTRPAAHHTAAAMLASDVVSLLSCSGSEGEWWVSVAAVADPVLPSRSLLHAFVRLVYDDVTAIFTSPSSSPSNTKPPTPVTSLPPLPETANGRCPLVCFAQPREALSYLCWRIQCGEQRSSSSGSSWSAPRRHPAIFGSHVVAPPIATVSPLAVLQEAAIRLVLLALSEVEVGAAFPADIMTTANKSGSDGDDANHFRRSQHPDGTVKSISRAFHPHQGKARADPTAHPDEQRADWRLLAALLSWPTSSWSLHHKLREAVLFCLLRTAKDPTRDDVESSLPPRQRTRLSSSSSSNNRNRNRNSSNEQTKAMVVGRANERSPVATHSDLLRRLCVALFEAHAQLVQYELTMLASLKTLESSRSPSSFGATEEIRVSCRYVWDVVAQLLPLPRGKPSDRGALGNERLEGQAALGRTVMPVMSLLQEHLVEQLWRLSLPSWNLLAEGEAVRVEAERDMVWRLLAAFPAVAGRSLREAMFCRLAPFNVSSLPSLLSSSSSSSTSKGNRTAREVPTPLSPVSFPSSWQFYGLWHFFVDVLHASAAAVCSPPRPSSAIIGVKRAAAPPSLVRSAVAWLLCVQGSLDPLTLLDVLSLPTSPSSPPTQGECAARFRRLTAALRCLAAGVYVTTPVAPSLASRCDPTRRHWAQGFAAPLLQHWLAVEKNARRCSALTASITAGDESWRQFWNGKRTAPQEEAERQEPGETRSSSSHTRNLHVPLSEKEARAVKMLSVVPRPLAREIVAGALRPLPGNDPVAAVPATSQSSSSSSSRPFFWFDVEVMETLLHAAGYAPIMLSAAGGGGETDHLRRWGQKDRGSDRLAEEAQRLRVANHTALRDACRGLLYPTASSASSSSHGRDGQPCDAPEEAAFFLAQLAERAVMAPFASPTRLSPVASLLHFPWSGEEAAAPSLPFSSSWAGVKSWTDLSCRLLREEPPAQRTSPLLRDGTPERLLPLTQQILFDVLIEALDEEAELWGGGGAACVETPIKQHREEVPPFQEQRTATPSPQVTHSPEMSHEEVERFTEREAKRPSPSRAVTPFRSVADMVRSILLLLERSTDPTPVAAPASPTFQFLHERLLPWLQHRLDVLRQHPASTTRNRHPTIAPSIASRTTSRVDNVRQANGRQGGWGAFLSRFVVELLEPLLLPLLQPQQDPSLSPQDVLPLDLHRRDAAAAARTWGLPSTVIHWCWWRSSSPLHCSPGDASSAAVSSPLPSSPIVVLQTLRLVLCHVAALSQISAAVAVGEHLSRRRDEVLQRLYRQFTEVCSPLLVEATGVPSTGTRSSSLTDLYTRSTDSDEAPLTAFFRHWLQCGVWVGAWRDLNWIAQRRRWREEQQRLEYSPPTHSRSPPSAVKASPTAEDSGLQLSLELAVVGVECLVSGSHSKRHGNDVPPVVPTEMSWPQRVLQRTADQVVIAAAKASISRCGSFHSSGGPSPSYLQRLWQTQPLQIAVACLSAVLKEGKEVGTAPLLSRVCTVYWNSQCAPPDLTVGVLETCPSLRWSEKKQNETTHLSRPAASSDVNSPFGSTTRPASSSSQTISTSGEKAQRETERVKDLQQLPPVSEGDLVLQRQVEAALQQLATAPPAVLRVLVDRVQHRTAVGHRAPASIPNPEESRCAEELWDAWWFLRVHFTMLPPPRLRAALVTLATSAPALPHTEAFIPMSWSTTAMRACAHWSEGLQLLEVSWQTLRCSEGFKGSSDKCIVFGHRSSFEKEALLRTETSGASSGGGRLRLPPSTSVQHLLLQCLLEQLRAPHSALKQQEGGHGGSASQWCGWTTKNHESNAPSAGFALPFREGLHSFTLPLIARPLYREAEPLPGAASPSPARSGWLLVAELRRRAAHSSTPSQWHGRTALVLYGYALCVLGPKAIALADRTAERTRSTNTGEASLWDHLISWHETEAALRWARTRPLRVPIPQRLFLEFMRHIAAAPDSGGLCAAFYQLYLLQGYRRVEGVHPFLSLLRAAKHSLIREQQVQQRYLPLHVHSLAPEDVSGGEKQPISSPPSSALSLSITPLLPGLALMLLAMDGYFQCKAVAASRRSTSLAIFRKEKDVVWHTLFGGSELLEEWRRRLLSPPGDAQRPRGSEEIPLAVSLAEALAWYGAESRGVSSERGRRTRLAFSAATTALRAPHLVWSAFMDAARSVKRYCQCVQQHQQQTALRESSTTTDSNVRKDESVVEVEQLLLAVTCVLERHQIITEVEVLQMEVLIHMPLPASS